MFDTQPKQYEGLTVNTIGFMEGWGGKVLDEDGNVTVDSDEGPRLASELSLMPTKMAPSPVSPPRQPKRPT